MSGTITTPDGESLTFDVVVREKYGPRNSVTEHPVEDGSVTSDHIQQRPEEITVIAIVSETPFAPDGTQIQPTRRTDAAQFLRRAMKDTITYESIRQGTFENMTILAVDYEENEVREYVFTIGLKEIRIAEAQLVAIPPEILPPKKKPDVPEEKPCGHQTPKKEKDPGDPEVQNDGELKSFAASGRDAAAERDLVPSTIEELTAP